MDLIWETFTAPLNARFERADTQVIEREGWSQVLTPSMPMIWRNTVGLSVLPSDANVDRVIDDTLAQYGAHNLPVRWLVGPPTRPLDMAARLRGRQPEEHQLRGMCVDVDAPIPHPDGVNVRQIELTDLDAWNDVTSRGWESPPTERVRDDWAWAIGQKERQFFIARVNGQLAGSAATVICPKVGYLIGAQVLPQFRGRGVYRALLAARLKRLRGVRQVATTQALVETSAPILRRLGFTDLFGCTMFIFDPKRSDSTL
ncbi:MAG: GNAT family N-acetyltransferase [Myxococcales bacterium]|nr:GNAT family N-acetyltransferase [Myxococcales bacterium]